MAQDARMNRRLIGMCSARTRELGLGAVLDPRVRVGRWNLEPLLAMALVGLVAGCKNLRDVERLSKKLPKAVRKRLGVWRRLPDTTERDLLVRMAPEALRSVLHRQVKLALRRKALRPDRFPLGVVAIDGRTTATPMTDENTYAQTQHDRFHRERCGLVRTMTATLISSRVQPCLDACPIPPDTNEMATFAQALGMLDTTYSESVFQMVAADSGSCSKANGQLVEDAHRAYLFRLKEGDQPTLYAEAERLLGALRPESAEAETVDQRGQETVTRRVWLTREMAGWHDWTHLRTVVRVESETIDEHGEVSVEQRYYVSSLRQARLSPSRWLQLVRLYWGVENGNHWVFDAILNEDDRPWILEPQGMLAVMMLRRIAFNMLALFRSVTQRSEERRQMPWKDLIEDVRDALVSAKESELRGLRLRQEVAIA